MKRYITVLNIISAIAVVILHTNNPTFFNFSFERCWITANIIESVFYFAVPVFFMISGATLIDYNERYTTKEFIIKRIKKTVIPFCIWSLIGFAYLSIIYGFDKTTFTIGNLFIDIFNCKVISIYWYFIPQFAVYLFIPVLAAISKEKRKTLFGYCIVVYIMFNVILPLMFNIFKIQYNYGMILPITGYVIYLFIGYYLDNYEIDKKCRCLIYFMGCLGLLLQILGTWYMSYNIGAIDETFKGYLNLPCILYSSSVFLLVKNIHIHGVRINTLINKIINYFKGTTFGIYLVHWYLLDLSVKYLGFINQQSIIYRIPYAIVVFVVAGTIIKILQKFRIFRYIVPR